MTDRAGRGRGFWTGIAVLVVVALVALGVIVTSGGGDDDGPDVGESTSDNPAAGDVAIDGCVREDLSGTATVKVTGRITNSSSEPSNYIVNIEVVGPEGDRLGGAVQSSNDVAPGQEVPFATTSFLTAQSTAPVTCRVADLSRFVSG